MNPRRQRAWLWLLIVLVLTGCQARSSAEAAQTAVAVAQTAIPALPSVADQLRPLLPGVALDVQITPADAPSQSVTQVSISGTDAFGALAQLDPLARDGAASAALMVASRYYPKATIVLEIRDARGGTLLRTSRQPGDA